MEKLDSATAWSPVFPFGATANPTADLSPDTIRDTIADMVARIVGLNRSGVSGGSDVPAKTVPDR